MVYPCIPQFYYIKVGFKVVFIAQTCFPDENQVIFSDFNDLPSVKQSEHLLKQVILKSRSRVIFWLQEKTCNSMNKCLLFLFYFEFRAVFLILSYPRGQCKDAPFSHMVRGS